MSEGEGDNDTCDVLIVGGGLSGLGCAHLLIQAGVDVLVLEAANRFGGRIHSLYDTKDNSTLADFGPTWVWPQYQPIVESWLGRLGLDTFEQYTTGKSILEYSAQQPVSHQLLPSQEGIRRIIGGPQVIINTLLKSLPGDALRYSQAVVSIHEDTNAFTVKTQGENGKSYQANKVVISTPLPIAANNIDWPAGFDANLLAQMSNAPTWMATQAKAVIEYDKPFWRAEGLSGRIASQIGPLVESHDHCLAEIENTAAASRGYLFGFIGWNHSKRAQFRDDLIPAIQQQLIHCFGGEGANYRKIEVVDWASNPFICHQNDLVGEPSHPEILPDYFRQPQLQNKLFLCVAETARQSPGLIEGAMESAMRTVAQILAE